MSAKNAGRSLPPIPGNTLHRKKHPPEYPTRIQKRYGDLSGFHPGVPEIQVENQTSFRKSRGTGLTNPTPGQGPLTAEGFNLKRRRKRIQTAFQKRRMDACGPCGPFMGKTLEGTVNRQQGTAFADSACGPCNSWTCKPHQAGLVGR